MNMTEFSDETDSQGTYSSVIPYWKKDAEFVIGDKVDSTGATAGGHGECVPLDLSDKFESKPTKAQVEQMASDLMQTSNPFLPVQNIKVSFVRLQDLGYEGLENLMKCELLDLLAETKKDGSVYSDVVKKIFGEEEKQKLYDALRTEDGIVPLINSDGNTYSITDAVAEVMGALGPEGKN